jgi:hypothetical protein
MPDYSKGKVYKIVVDTEMEYKPYIGSTCESLSRRMSEHRSNYKRKGKNISSHELFDKFGVENCKIILLEEYPCENREQLMMKEREWFDKIECCNKKRPYNSPEEKIELDKKCKKKYAETHDRKEYFEINKERFSQQKKEYREANRDKISQQRKESYQENKEKISQQRKEYREENAEKINARKTEKVACECGKMVSNQNLARHRKTHS